MDMVKSQIAKFLTIEQVKEMANRLGAAPGDMLMIAAGDDAAVSNVLGRMRLEMANRLKLADPDLFAYCFVVNFPLFAWDDKMIAGNRCIILLRLQRKEIYLFLNQIRERYLARVMILY
jgi:aspartyl-tRNA synthetase